MDFREHVAERFGGELRGFVKAAGGEVDGFSRGIVNGEAQMHARAVSCGGLGIGDYFAEGAGQTVAAADDADARAVGDAARGFRQKIFVQNIQNGADFGSGTLPVGGGKREEREGVNAEAWGGFDDGASGFGSGTVPGGPRKSLGGGPAAVAVRNDGYVQRVLRGGLCRRRQESSDICGG